MRVPRDADLLPPSRNPLLGGDRERLSDLRGLGSLGGDRDLVRW